MNINATHAERTPTLQWHLSEVIAKHLTYFKMEIEVTPLETFDENVYAGYRHAYQIKDVDGSCCRR